MILAKGKPIHVFGEGTGHICVRLAGKKASAGCTDGRWDVTLPAMKAGGPYSMTIRSGKDRIILNDIYIGNVIMVSGQSNMQFKLRESSTPEEEWFSDPLLRSYSLPRMEEGEPFSPEDGWIACTEDNAITGLSYKNKKINRVFKCGQEITNGAVSGSTIRQPHLHMYSHLSNLDSASSWYCCSSH